MKNKSYDKKIFRLLFILNKLESEGKIRTPELAVEFHINIRSVQRDLELLNRAGFPLVMLSKGTYVFVEGFSLKKLMVSHEEASLLSFLYEISKGLGKNFEDSFSGILKKVLPQDVESSFYAKIPEGTKLGKGTTFIKELNEAIRESRKIEFYYLKQGKEKWFRVHPLKIAFFDGFWYLVSRIDAKDWIFKFRIENIKKIKVLDETFKLPKNLQVMLDQSVNIWFSEKRDQKIVLKVDKDVASFFKQKLYFPLQKIVKENKDGSLILESTACQYEEIIPIVLKWIPYVEIVNPKDLKLRIVAKIKQYGAKIGQSLG